MSWDSGAPSTIVMKERCREVVMVLWYYGTIWWYYGIIAWVAWSRCGWCEVGSRLVLGGPSVVPTPPHHPAQVKTGDRLCVLCSLSVLRPGLRSPDLSCQRGAAD